MSTETCPNGCDLRGTEIPVEDRDYYAPGTTHYSRLIGHEVPGVYDGTLYWSCPDCGHRWHRWPEGHGLHTAAAPYVVAV